ncbi:hypothetical protein [Mammaliicoccus lentus]|uniref:hypothetical protein n=1 Tax=Mammaliicoccus lentus TaxID=42858 RepID=UPI003CF6A5AF
MITIQKLIERLNCSEVYARKFMSMCNFDQDLIRKELQRQIHKRETTPAITINKPLEEVII